MKKEKDYVAKFYSDNKTKFDTKRQASKYLNHHGKVWKEERNIPLLAPKRG